MLDVIDGAALAARDPASLTALERGVRETGFLLLENTALGADRVEAVLTAYAGFFGLPAAQKAKVDMARTGATRGWGAGQAEQVNPDANPDYKEVFDCGAALPEGHPLRTAHPEVHGANVWPDAPEGFRATIEGYFAGACAVSDLLLARIGSVLGQGEDAFAGKFDPPMAMLRGNYYPARPDWAGDKDFGIAAHTDYGCLTLLATDGAPGLEVEMPDGAWLAVEAAPGRFVVNFGEMLERWSGGAVRATPHRVVGGAGERISVPLFYNPSFETNVAEPGEEAVSAGDYLSARYRETYVHLQMS